MDRVQSAADPIVNRPPTDARLHQLPATHHPMLSARKLSEQTIHITSAAFAPNNLVNAALVPGSHGIDAEPARRADGAQNVKRGSNPPLPPLALIP
jgi:hypothetical protein